MRADGGLTSGLPPVGHAGDEIYALARRIFPYNRSITGNGVRQTLREVQTIAPVEIREVASGGEALDWRVPREWNLRAAYIADAQGRRIVDASEHNLHVVNYAMPVRRRMSLAELQPHLHSLPEQPDLIPYQTSFYHDGWGFCLPHRQRLALVEDTYEVVIDTTLEAGSLTYGELYLPGESDDEILLSTHICHPSLANDNCSGLALMAWLGRHLASAKRRLSYRLLFVPGTIGAITWLSRNRDRVDRIVSGMVVSNVGDGGGPTYKRSRRGNAAIDRAAANLLANAGPTARIMDFVPVGYDERQYCSPGFNLPIGLLQRSQFGTFPEYHTSADNLDFIRPEHLDFSLRLVCSLLDVIERDCVPMSTAPYGEPQLGRRGLFSDAGGRPIGSDLRLAQLWVLNMADGQNSLIDIAERSGLAFEVVRHATDRLASAGLVTERPVRRR